MAQNISYKSTFRGAVFFFPLSNIPRICSNCALVMSLGYFFLIFLLYRFSLTLNRFLERLLLTYEHWRHLSKLCPPLPRTPITSSPPYSRMLNNPPNRSAKSSVIIRTALRTALCCASLRESFPWRVFPVTLLFRTAASYVRALETSFKTLSSASS